MLNGDDKVLAKFHAKLQPPLQHVKSLGLDPQEHFVFV